MSKKSQKTTKTPTTETNTAINPQSPEDAQAIVMGSTDFMSTYIAVIAQTSMALRELVQNGAMQSLLRAYGEDNFDYINKLFVTVEQNMSIANAKQLRVWFETYSPAKLRKTDKGHTFRKDTGDEALDFDFVNAALNPWYGIELLTGSEAKSLYSVANLDSSIENLIKKANKAINDGTVENEELVALRINALQELLDAAPLIIATPDVDTIVDELVANEETDTAEVQSEAA